MESLKLLIIEDDADQRDLIRETLEDHFGIGTVVGVDSRRARYRQDLHSFDLILSDYNLPDGTGMDLLTEVKAPVFDPGHPGDRRERRPYRRRGDPPRGHRLRGKGRRLPVHHSTGRGEKPYRRQGQARERTAPSGAGKGPGRSSRQKPAIGEIAQARRRGGRHRSAHGLVQPPALREAAGAALFRITARTKKTCRAS